MLDIFKVVLVTFICGFMLVSCDSQKEELVETHNYEGREFKIIVEVFDSRLELNKTLEKLYPEYKGKELEGLALWSITKDMENMDLCTVYVVRPKHAEDNPEFTTWGHELVHCIYGSFHKQ